MGNIIFKGVNSSTINGLLISEQPDITRPSRKQEVIEVDGRDGDVVNYLGYESYKKTALVGLYSSFNVDEIFNYFGGEGWVTFANEPTKKYWGRIVDNIDLERRIRFRTGKVTWIVQPYKKLVTENDVTSSTNNFTVVNQGYEDALPVITIVAPAGNVVGIKVNTILVATITMPPEGTITLDSEALNCFNSNADKNQYVVGKFATLKAGNNTIGWTGTVTSVKVKPNSRFL